MFRDLGRRTTAPLAATAWAIRAQGALNDNKELASDS